MTNLVPAGLAGPAAIAVHFRGNFQRVRPVALHEKIDALLAGPALGVQAAVDDMAAAAKRDRLQIAEAAGGEVIIDAKLVDQLFRVERPAFGISIEREQSADQWQLVRIFALPHVSRDRLMRRKVRKAVPAVEVGSPKIDPEPARYLAVDRTGAAISGRRPGFLLGRHALHFEMTRNQSVEPAWKDCPNLRQTFVDIGSDLGAALVPFAELVAWVPRERLHALAHTALRIADRLQDRVHPDLQLLQLLKTHLMDFVGGKIGCRRSLKG